MRTHMKYRQRHLIRNVAREVIPTVLFGVAMIIVTLITLSF